MYSTAHDVLMNMVMAMFVIVLMFFHRCGYAVINNKFLLLSVFVVMSMAMNGIMLMLMGF